MKTSLRRAFTIVELLIVIVVIGILAAVTVVAFNGITKQAEISILKSDLQTAGKKIENFKTTSGAYPGSLTAAEVKTKESVQYAFTSDAGSFCLQVTPNRTGASSYYITHTGSVRDGVCPTTVAACFAFTAATFTITDYYDRESNNAANPACPRSVIIPSTIGGVAVRVVGEAAFTSKALTSLLIPNSVTTIDDTAFQHNQLKSISIPSSVTTMDYAVFDDNQLTSLTFASPSSLTSINSAAFSNNQIASVTIPTSVITIEAQAFTNNQIASLTFASPSSLTTLSVISFSNNKLTSASIPSSVTTLGPSVFSDNPLTSLRIAARDIPYGLTSSPCTLTSLILEEGVRTIGGGAFVDCPITSLNIPKSVTTIGGGAFAYSPINSLTFSTPSSVTLIEGGAFIFGSTFTSVSIPAATVVTNGAFKAGVTINRY